MSEFIGGIKPLGPTYPVTPVQRSNKDREPAKRRPPEKEPPSEQQDDDDQQPHIDELA